MDKYWGHRNKKHKKQPFGDASASHLSLVLWHVWFQAEAWISHTTSPTPPSYEVGSIAKRIKTARLRRKTKPGRDAIIRVRVKWLIFNTLSQSWVNVKYHIFTITLFESGVFRRETASGFYPWGKVEDPRKRVAVRVCGWRHGNSFPMTQSTQSHRQMRSIPRCSKAVFYVFVFDSIHNSATV